MLDVGESWMMILRRCFIVVLVLLPLVTRVFAARRGRFRTLERSDARNRMSQSINMYYDCTSSVIIVEIIKKATRVIPTINNLQQVSLTSSMTYRHKHVKEMSTYTSLLTLSFGQKPCPDSSPSIVVHNLACQWLACQ